MVSRNRDNDTRPQLFVADLSYQMKWRGRLLANDRFEFFPAGASRRLAVRGRGGRVFRKLCCCTGGPGKSPKKSKFFMSDRQKQDKKCLLVSMAVIFISRIRAPCEVSDHVAV